jgi:tetratricopeptide (TPR) repeat protein
MFRGRDRLRDFCITTALFTLGAGATSRLLTAHVHAQSASRSEPGGAAAGSSGGPSDPDHVAPYKLPFGPNPYLPSQATADFPGFLKPSDIPSAAYCARCHAGVHAQWRQSAHANSFRTPWYVKNVNELATTKGVAYTRHCEGCHNPAAVFTGALTEGSTVPRPNDDDGVTCMVCHSIRKVTSTKGIGSYVMGRPAVMVDANGEAVPGLPSDREILAHLDWHKNAVMRPLYRTPEFCGSCHKAAIPKMLNDYKWLRTFSTYDEWQQSSWSRETPMTFYTKNSASTCQTCHMPREPVADQAAHDGMAASHRWLGANTAVSTQYGYDEQTRRLEAFLRDDKLQVDIFALTIERAGKTTTQFVPGTLIAPLGTAGFTVLPGDSVRVDVVVRNKGIGHTLVPELRDFYESWLDFEAKDDSGQTIYRSGGLDANHAVDPDARSYTLRIVSRDGQSLDHHQVWKTYVKAYDATVSPGRADVVRYRFRVPENSKGVTLTAAVRYRRFRKSFVDWVFADKPDAPERFPTVTLASGSFHFAAGVNLPHREETLAPDLTDLLRWNNYGIGMLDRQQFAEAVDAFKHVVAIDPRYEPGYVNVAVAEYSRGRYVDALGWIDRSTHLDPADARAMYYKGLCLRWQTRYDEAIAALAPVARQYPRFRQVHQELGYIYMVRKRFAEAKAEYETVLEIDPDDPTTHRWLGPVYAALGDTAGAAREAAIAAQVVDDRAAGWVAQKFWREHLSVASESMPTHTFSQTGLGDDSDVRRMLNLQNPPSYIWVEHY